MTFRILTARDRRERGNPQRGLWEFLKFSAYVEIWQLFPSNTRSAHPGTSCRLAWFLFYGFERRTANSIPGKRAPQKATKPQKKLYSCEKNQLQLWVKNITAVTFRYSSIKVCNMVWVWGSFFEAFFSAEILKNILVFFPRMLVSPSGSVAIAVLYHGTR